jgi:hypothetical protein
MFSISPYQTVMETQLHLAIKPVQMKYSDTDSDTEKYQSNTL